MQDCIDVTAHLVNVVGGVIPASALNLGGITAYTSSLLVVRADFNPDQAYPWGVVQYHSPRLGSPVVLPLLSPEAVSATLPGWLMDKWEVAFVSVPKDIRKALKAAMKARGVRRFTTTGNRIMNVSGSKSGAWDLSVPSGLFRNYFKLLRQAPVDLNRVLEGIRMRLFEPPAVACGSGDDGKDKPRLA